jgi:hypothetical protein
MGLLFDGYEMPLREELGDLDPKEWDLGLNNEPQDPWLHQQNIVLQHTETKRAFHLQHHEQDGPARRW